ncbi:MAG: hypothetical protein IKD10_05870 [Lentisphaeria bacterium]|nr:hypothetical protein [Lentisphaeria bacterium]
MGSFIHYCKHCNAKLNVDDAWLGKSMKCPACNKKITFPNADGSVEQSQPTIDLQVPLRSADADFPSAPQTPAVPASDEMPSAPDFRLPDPPTKTNVGSASGTGSSPRRIKLKPLQGKNETVDTKVGNSLAASAGDELPPPPFVPDMPEPPAKVQDALPEVSKVEFEDMNTVSEMTEMPEFPGQKMNINTEEIPSVNSQSAVAPAAECVVVPVRKGFFNGSYFWGRLGSASVYVLAVVMVLTGIYYSFHCYWDYRAAEDRIPEKQALVNVNKELGIREKGLSEQFKNAINLLQGSGAVSKDGVLDGLVLSDTICRRPDPMPLGILTSRELKVAQDVLLQYKNSNAKLKEEFIKCFGKVLSLQKNDAGSAAGSNILQIILKAGEIKKQFYSNERAKLAQLDLLDNIVQQVKKYANNTPEVKRFEAASSFVRKQLFPAENNVTVVKTSNAVSSGGINSQNDLSKGASLIVSLANGWRLDEEIAAMEKLLEKVPVLTEAYEKKKNDHLRKMGKELVTLWLKTLLTAFALLVLGDVLRAFFDKADILHRIEGKK